MTATSTATRMPAPRAQPPETPRRWTALAFIALAQLMVALDATIVSIALPSAQAALHASDAERQWVITAYTMAFGGLLLLGGKVADRLGRKRTFLIGLAGFACASALGGVAVNFEMLVAARAVQGVFAALLTPTALSLLAVTFTEPRERATAFAVYGGIAGSGAAVGLVLGGALTQYLSWRWCLFVNIPVALVAAAGGSVVLRATPRSGGRARLDLPGALLATSALVALVYGCSTAVTDGWGSAAVIGTLAASGLLGVAFVVRQRFGSAPLLPLRIVLDRNRGGAFIVALFAVAGMFGAFLLITYYLQVVKGFSPLEAGLGFLPITVASQTSSWLVARRFMPRVQPRALIAPGLLIAAGGMALLTQVQAGSGYAWPILPAELLLGFGLACALVPTFNVATLGVDVREAGVAAAVVNTAQQVGASIGTALLNTVAASATAAYIASSAGVAANRAGALVHGYATATGWAAAVLLGGALIAAMLISAPRPAGRPSAG